MFKGVILIYKSIIFLSPLKIFLFFLLFIFSKQISKIFLNTLLDLSFFFKIKLFSLKFQYFLINSINLDIIVNLNMVLDYIIKINADSIIRSPCILYFFKYSIALSP